MLSQEAKDYWESQAQSKAARQPQIRDDIIENNRANPSKSYGQLAIDIDSWASVAAIQTWYKKQGAGMMYSERALPFLTSVERAKHVTFCRHLRNNWGLAEQKILWIHYDEKWFYSWVSRQAANICELLGLEKTHTYHYDKCHIDKVMAVAFTAFAFDQSIEDGGKGIKLGFYRVQEARVAKKLVKKNRRDENGRYDGEIVRDEGDTYLIDYNMTGSNDWTWDKPKFSLLSLFRDHIFPKVLDSVSEGGLPGG
jgi:hypothetical protein